jgi:hypothetical protein
LDIGPFVSGGVIETSVARLIVDTLHVGFDPLHRFQYARFVQLREASIWTWQLQIRKAIGAQSGIDAAVWGFATEQTE